MLGIMKSRKLNMQINLYNEDKKEKVRSRSWSTLSATFKKIIFYIPACDAFVIATGESQTK